MRAQLVGVTKHHGGQVVLDGASLAVGPRARIGLVGPNGVGKSTVLRLLAGEETPDGGAVVLDPPDLTVAHMPQEPDVRPGETLLEALARRTGIAAAEHELQAAATTLAGVRRRRGGGRALRPCPEPVPRPRWGRPRAAGGEAVRGSAARRRPRPTARRAVGRRDRPGIARRGPARARRCPAPRRADERPRRRRARAARGVRRVVSRRGRRRLTRSRVPRRHRRPHRRDRPALAAHRGVVGRLVGVRGASRCRPRRGV